MFANTVVCLLGVLVIQGDPVRAFDAQTMVIAARASAAEKDRQQATSQEQHAFQQKFDRLIDTLKDFKGTYNGSRGLVWPVKEAQALKTALRQLEQAMPDYKKTSNRQR